MGLFKKKIRIKQIIWHLKINVVFVFAMFKNVIMDFHFITFNMKSIVKEAIEWHDEPMIVAKYDEQTRRVKNNKASWVGYILRFFIACYVKVVAAPTEVNTGATVHTIGLLNRVAHG